MLLPRSCGPIHTQESNLKFDLIVYFENKRTVSHTLDTDFLALGKLCVMNSSADIDSFIQPLSSSENSLPDRLMMKFFLSLSYILKNKNKAIHRIMTSK